MKSTILAVAMATSVGAVHLKRHAHEIAHDDIKLRAIMASGTSALIPTGIPSNATCGCTTIYETITGAMSWVPNAPAPTIATTSVSPVAAVATSSSISTSSISSSVSIAPTISSVAPVSSSTSSIVIIPTSSTIASSSAASPSSSSSSSSSSGNSGSITGSECKGITYTPYTSTGACNTYSQVLSDLTQIKAKGFNAVRTYSTDCSTLENVGGAASSLGLKLIMGIYIDSTGVNGNAATQVTAIASWAKWDIIDMFVVGNEAVFNGFCTASELVSFIQSTKTTFSAAGYTGKYTTTEPLNIVYELVATPGFCDSIDYVGGNYHPFFNADVSASSAGAFVASQLQIADGLCAGKSGINLETGWPSEGTCNGEACPSSENQQIAVSSIVQTAGANSVVFSFQNDLWKSLGEFDCEQSWGLVTLFE